MEGNVIIKSTAVSNFRSDIGVDVTCSCLWFYLRALK